MGISHLHAGAAGVHGGGARGRRVLVIGADGIGGYGKPADGNATWGRSSCRSGGQGRSRPYPFSRRAVPHALMIEALGLPVRVLLHLSVRPSGRYSRRMATECLILGSDGAGARRLRTGRTVIERFLRCRGAGRSADCNVPDAGTVCAATQAGVDDPSVSIGRRFARPAWLQLVEPMLAART